MTVPSLGAPVQGQGIIPADHLNTYVQTAQNTAQLRTLTGLTGMDVFLQGISQPNDGGGGDFYWNADGTEPDDNYNYIQPPGSTGQWWRVAVRASGGAGSIVLEAGTASCGGGDTVTGTISTLYFDQGQLYVDGDFATYLPEFNVINGELLLGSASTLQANGNITVGLTAGVAVLTSAGGTGSSGLTELVAGTLIGTGAVTMGQGLSFSGTTNPTLLNEGVISFSGTTGTITLGPSLSMSGQTLDVTGIGTMQAVVGTVVQGVATLHAGANMSFSGTAPQLTLVASTTASSNITVENQGTSIGTVGTINALGNVTAAVSGGIATLTSGAGGSGALVLITSVTASGAPSEVDLLGVFSATYDTYLIELVGFQPTANGDSLLLQFGNQSGPTWETSSNYYWSQMKQGNNSAYGNEYSGPSGVTSANLFYQFYSGYPNELSLKIKNPLSTTLKKSLYGNGVDWDGSNINQIQVMGVLSTTTAYDSFRVLMSASTVASGTVRVYGLVT